MWLKYLDKPKVLHSGQSSHWFVDGDEIFNDEHLRESVLQFWSQEVYEVYPDTLPHFVPIPRGGNRWAEAIANLMRTTWGVPLFEGSNIPVDDVLTTGSSFEKLEFAYDKIGLVVVARDPVKARELKVEAWAGLNLESNYQVK